jgi:hypothetical protein
MSSLASPFINTGRPVVMPRCGHQPFQRLTIAAMSVHSYSRCWIHLIWGRLNRERLLDKEAATRLSRFLSELLKGSSSHWINANNILAAKFAWARGYGAFSVSESNVDQGAAYIADKSNTIVSARSLTSCRSSSHDMGCKPCRREAVEMATLASTVHAPA